MMLMLSQKNGNGVLDGSELAAALKKLGSSATLEELDTDGDGVISFEEFAVIATLTDKHSHIIFKQPLKSKCADLIETDSAMVAKAKDVCKHLVSTMRTDDTTLLKEFHKLDDDGDARLTKTELKYLINKNMPEATMAEKQILLFTTFSVADVNRDDSISFDEFKMVMQA